MQAIVHYKFKNAKTNWDSVAFDGGVISVLDLKRAIVTQKKLAKTAGEFDLLITNAQTGEDYRDDNYLIPKNSSVVIRRVPASRARSLTVRLNETTNGNAPALTAPQLSREEKSGDDFGGAIYTAGASASAEPEADSDEAKMMALISRPPEAKPAQLVRTTVSQVGMRNAGRIVAAAPTLTLVRGGGGMEDGKPPRGYFCFRCGSPDHFIRNCPQAGNPDYDRRHFPGPSPAYARNYLRPVEDPKRIDGGPGPGPAGPAPLDDFAPPPLEPAPPVVRAVPQQPRIAHPSLDSDDTRGGRQVLLCPICGGHMRDATVIDCCMSSFCEECIRQALVVSSTCPLCKQTNTPEGLRPNKALQKAVDDYVAKHGRLPPNRGGPINSPSGPKPSAARVPSPAPLPEQRSLSPPHRSASASAVSPQPAASMQSPGPAPPAAQPRPQHPPQHHQPYYPPPHRGPPSHSHSHAHAGPRPYEPHFPPHHQQQHHREHQFPSFPPPRRPEPATVVKTSSEPIPLSSVAVVQPVAMQVDSTSTSSNGAAAAPSHDPRRPADPSLPIICGRCGGEGHTSRECPNVGMGGAVLAGGGGDRGGGRGGFDRRRPPPRAAGPGPASWQQQQQQPIATAGYQDYPRAGYPPQQPAYPPREYEQQQSWSTSTGSSRPREDYGDRRSNTGRRQASRSPEDRSRRSKRPRTEDDDRERREHDSHRDRDRERDRDRSRDRDRERDRERSRDRDRERPRDHDRDREMAIEREREQERERERERERLKEKDRESAKERDRTHERSSKERSKGADGWLAPPGDGQKDGDKEKDKEKERAAAEAKKEARKEKEKEKSDKTAASSPRASGGLSVSVNANTISSTSTRIERLVESRIVDAAASASESEPKSVASVIVAPSPMPGVARPRSKDTDKEKDKEKDKKRKDKDSHKSSRHKEHSSSSRKRSRHSKDGEDKEKEKEHKHKKSKKDSKDKEKDRKHRSKADD